ncbi:MAG: hypothetical protein DRP74_07935 [Candidatus Omnitrophota bacterium]|nr:MAG: hypothetical protein DRP74_07935 [Candidatus Omnitrophota bacterium]
MADLRLVNINKNFDKVQALSGVNLTIKQGSFCVILGPSGCGKSTLLNLIAGLEEASQGKVYLGEKEITGLPPHKRNMAMVFQNYALYPHLSVFENIAFGLRIKKEKEKQIKEKIEQVSKALNLEDKLGRLPRELSGGEKQRVATGRAIVRDPELFLFDEPLSNLDARLRVELRSQFIKLHQRIKKTIIYVTHDQLEAMALGEIIVVIKNGRIQQISPAQELYAVPQNLFVASFIGSPPMNIIKFTLKKKDTKIQLIKENLVIELTNDVTQKILSYLGQDIYLGFRPSAVRFGPAGQIKGKVIFIENIGEDSYAHIEIIEGTEIIAKVNDKDARVGKNSVNFNIDNQAMHFFDLQEKRI